MKMVIQHMKKSECMRVCMAHKHTCSHATCMHTHMHSLFFVCCQGEGWELGPGWCSFGCRPSPQGLCSKDIHLSCALKLDLTGRGSAARHSSHSLEFAAAKCTYDPVLFFPWSVPVAFCQAFCTMHSQQFSKCCLCGDQLPGRLPDEWGPTMLAVHNVIAIFYF